MRMYIFCHFHYIRESRFFQGRWKRVWIPDHVGNDKKPLFGKSFSFLLLSQYAGKMETLMKADIFFFISSVALIVLTIFVSIILCYLIKASRNLYMLSEELQERFAESEEFVAELKERLEDNPIFRFFFPRWRRRKRSAGNKDGKK